MDAANHTKSFAFAACLISAAALCAQPRGRQPQPEFIREGRQLMRQGKLDEALTLYRRELQKTPESSAANTAAGIVLDLMGRGEEARKYFATAIDAAPTAQAKANAQRAVAMSYAFEGDCGNTVKFEQQVFNHYVAVKNFYQQGEIADEAARVCIDSGNLDAAYKWYRTGHDAGLKEPGIKPDRVALWNFRWEHAQARIAARRGNKIEAQKHVAAAKALLDQNPEMAKGQAVFFPYLKGYVAFYSGDYHIALADLQQANQNDPFIQTLLGQTYEKLGNRDTAREYYRKAAMTTAHNPPAAYARRFAGKKLGTE
jgi:tetratricopeptide (TPR) repeat protein